MFKNNFLLYFIGQLVSLLGSTMQMVVLPLLILDITGSGSKMGLVVGTSTITFLLFSFYAGKKVDEHPNQQKNILATSDIVSGCILIFYLLFIKEITVVNILVLAILMNLPSSAFSASNNALFSKVVDENNLEKSNSIMSIGRNIVNILGPLFGMFIYIQFGFKFLLFVNMLSFIISGLFEYAIKINPINQEQLKNERKSQGYKDVLDYLKKNETLKDITYLSVVLNFILAPLFGVILFYFINESLSMESEFIGYYQSLIILGMLLGSFIVMKFSQKIQFKKYYLHLIAFQSILVLIFYFILNALYSLNPFYGKIFFIVAVPIIGIINSIIVIPLFSFLQEYVDYSIKGRFFVFYNGAKNIMVPVSAMLIGMALDHIDILLIVFIIISASLIIQIYYSKKKNLYKRHKAFIDSPSKLKKV